MPSSLFWPSRARGQNERPPAAQRRTPRQRGRRSLPDHACSEHRTAAPSRHVAVEVTERFAFRAREPKQLGGTSTLSSLSRDARDQSDDRCLRLITWNVARRVTRIVEQATALAVREPDVVALQEVTRRTLPLWRSAFEFMGLGHVRASLDGADPARVPATRRLTGVMLASRTALVDVRRPLVVPWPETAACASRRDQPRPGRGLLRPRSQCRQRLDQGQDPAGRPSWPDRRRTSTPRAVRRSQHAAARAARRAGDLVRVRLARTLASRPRAAVGRSRTWCRPRTARARLPGRVPRLARLRDTPEPSWTWKRIAGHHGGWRIDHIFASAQLRPVACRYHHAWRDQDLSDHSALEADLA